MHGQLKLVFPEDSFWFLTNSFLYSYSDASRWSKTHRTATEKLWQKVSLSSRPIPSAWDSPWTTQCSTTKSWTVQTSLANSRRKHLITPSPTLTHWRRTSTETQPPSCSSCVTTWHCGRATWMMLDATRKRKNSEEHHHTIYRCAEAKLLCSASVLLNLLRQHRWDHMRFLDYGVSYSWWLS